jgi:hypothetical protein
MVQEEGKRELGECSQLTTWRMAEGGEERLNGSAPLSALRLRGFFEIISAHYWCSFYCFRDFDKFNQSTLF